MAADPLVIYLHGVGGPRPGWAEHLLADIAEQPDLPVGIRVIAPRYTTELSPEQGETRSATTRRRSPQLSSPESLRAYRERQQLLADRIEQCTDVVPSGMAWPAILPRPSRFPILDLLESPARFIAGLDQARNYLREPQVRRAVLDSVHDSVDQPLARSAGPIVVIGHSLGAVIAIDLLRELDADISLLVTLGAPLGHADIAERLLEDDLDVSRLGGWLNVVHLLDPVPLGRGAAGLFPAAVDAFLPVLSGGNGLGGLARGLGRAATAHLDSTYLSSEVVRTVVVETLTAPVPTDWVAG